MGRYKTLSKSNPYYLPKHYYRHAISWCLQYPEWIKELDTDPDTSKAIDYSKDKVQTSNNYDATYEIAVRRMEMATKKKLLEDTIREVDESIFKYLILGLAYGFTVYQLKDRGMPCDNKYYYNRKQHVLYLINQRT